MKPWISLVLLVVVMTSSGCGGNADAARQQEKAKADEEEKLLRQQLRISELREAVALRKQVEANRMMLDTGNIEKPVPLAPKPVTPKPAIVTPPKFSLPFAPAPAPPPRPKPPPPPPTRDDRAEYRKALETAYSNGLQREKALFEKRLEKKKRIVENGLKERWYDFTYETSFDTKGNVIKGLSTKVYVPPKDPNRQIKFDEAMADLEISLTQERVRFEDGLAIRKAAFMACLR